MLKNDSVSVKLPSLMIKRSRKGVILTLNIERKILEHWNRVSFCKEYYNKRNEFINSE